MAADPVQMDLQNDLNLRSPPYLPSLSYATVSNDGKVSFTKSPKSQSFSSSPSSKQDSKSSFGSSMSQLRRWVMRMVGGNKDKKRG